MVSWGKLNIGELVERNHEHARILFYFGIHFLNYSERTLQQACEDKGLRLSQVLRALGQPEDEGQPPLDSCPVDLMIEYLRHAHHQFVKRRLPYLNELIKQVRPDSPGLETVLRDLKLVFPLFMDDFIRHIYEEEDTLFYYISTLLKVSRGKSIPISEVYYLMEKNSIQYFAMEHRQADDEMHGIRTITNQYQVPDGSGIGLQVLYRQLESFEQKLKMHARVEDEMLLPKALLLEMEAKMVVRTTISMN